MKTREEPRDEKKRRNSRTFGAKDKERKLMNGNGERWRRLWKKKNNQTRAEKDVSCVGSA